MNKDELARAKADAQIRELRRRSQIAALEDWFGFVTSKASGAAGILLGAGTLLHSSVMHVPDPGLWLGAGLGLLGGKRVLLTVTHVLNTALSTKAPIN